MAKAQIKKPNGTVPPPTIAGALQDTLDPQPLDMTPIRFPLGESQGFAAGTSIYGQSINWPRYNPDILLTRQGFEIYDKMAVDEQVKAVLEFKRDAIISRPWHFVFDAGNVQLDQQTKDDRIALMTEITGKMKGSFTDSLAFVMRAMRHGYSVTEKIFDLVEVQGKAYYGCTELRPKPPYSFYFKTDEFGTLVEFGQNYGGVRRALDIRKFVHYVQKPEEDQYFGRSELRSAYRSYYTKDVLVKMQALWAERIAGGFIVVEPDVNAPDLTATDFAMLRDAIASVKTISGMLLPKGYKANVISPPGTEAFSSLITYHDLAIAKALLVPNLLGLSHTGSTGAYAQSQTQLEAFLRTIQADTTRLEETMNDQVFRELGELNFADGIVPNFRFEAASDAFVQWVVSSWSTLVGANIVVNTEADEAHLRGLLAMPTRTEDDVPLVTPSQENAQKNAEATIALKTGPKAQEGALFGRKRVSRHAPRTCTKAAFSLAEARVMFAVIDNKSEAATQRAVADLASIMAGAVWRSIKSAKASDAPNDAVFAGSDMARIKKSCVAALREGWTLGNMTSSQELLKAHAPGFTRASFAAHSMTSTQAAEWVDSMGFRMAGNMADGARSIMQQELLNGLKTGARVSDTANVIYQRLIAKGFTTMEAVQGNVDDRDVVDALEQAAGAAAGGAPAYLNTLVRTNTFEAINEARFANFTDPTLGEFVEGLEYSAILDDRTTDVCLALDGLQADKDADLWDTYRPPNHYNCRSLLIPITAVDGWDRVDDEVPAGVEPQDGFGKGEK